MGWREEQRQRDEELKAEVERLGGLIADLKPKVTGRGPGEPAPHAPSRIAGLALSLRLCRDGETSLLRELRPVPREHDGAVIRSGAHGLHVACPCGGELDAGGLLEPCPGGCARWYVGDESGVWSVKLPVADAAAA